MDIIQKRIDNEHIDSFFYSGVIAKTNDFMLIATGETTFNCDDEPINDKEVQEYLDKNLFASNNWFEVINKDDPEAFEFSDFATGNYNDAIEMLQQVQDEYNIEQEKTQDSKFLDNL